MTNEKKVLEILVVEDNQEFIEVAKKAYEYMGVKAAYASTYEDAISYLETHKIDVVVSDLFFPAKTDFRKTLLEEAKIGLQQRIGWFIEKSWDKYIEKEKTFFEKYELRFSEFKEIPSGLEIARYCSKKEIPFCIASQGDRHGGDIAIVRQFIKFMPYLLKDINNDAIHKFSSDPFPDISVYDAGQVHKLIPDTWIDCIKTAYEIKTKQETGNW